MSNLIKVGEDGHPFNSCLLLNLIPVTRFAKRIYLSKASVPYMILKAIAWENFT